MALPNPNLPPEWLQALAILQQRQQEQLAAQQGGLTQAAALQAEPQAGFDDRFAGLEEAMAAAQAQQALPEQAQQPPVLPLAPYGERVLGAERPYEMGGIRGPNETLPAVNAFGRGMKNPPDWVPQPARYAISEGLGGVADYLSTVGSDQFHPRDALAATVDVMPGARMALSGLAATGKPALRQAQRFYETASKPRKIGAEVAWNMIPGTNPFQRPSDDPAFQR